MNWATRPKQRTLTFEEHHRLPTQLATLFPALRELHWTGTGRLDSQMPATLEVFRAASSEVPWPHLMGCPLLERVDGPGLLPDPGDLAPFQRLRVLNTKVSSLSQIIRLRRVIDAFPGLEVTLSISTPYIHLIDKTSLYRLRLRRFESEWWRDGDMLPWHFVNAESMRISFHDGPTHFDFGLLQESDLKAAGLRHLDLVLTVSPERVVQCPGHPFRVKIRTGPHWFSVTISWSAE